MPYSYSLFKNEFKNHLILNVRKTTAILDVGAGAGTYGKLLKNDFPNIDGIEIHLPYSQMFNLADNYKNLHVGDVRDFELTQYDYIILGDVLEHMTYEDARELLDRIAALDILCMVAIPYLFEQGVEYNNEFERHLQPDLTHEVFLERYPEFHCLWRDKNYGYYVNYEHTDNYQ